MSVVPGTSGLGGGMGFLGPAILASAGLQSGASLAGGKKGASAATNAAQLQFQAAQQALGLTQLTREQNLAELQPFADFGRSFLPAYGAALPGLTTPIDTSLPSFTFQPTMADLAATPGYQFTLQQALLAGQNALTSTGLGRSQSAVDTASQIAGGVAANTWPQVFNASLQGYEANTNALLAGRTMDLQQRQQIANLLQGPVNVGLSASGSLAGSNIQLANTGASAITQGGAALASGQVGAANALIAGGTGAANAIGGGVNSLANIALINSLGGGGGFNSLFGSPSVYSTGGGTGGL